MSFFIYKIFTNKYINNSKDDYLSLIKLVKPTINSDHVLIYKVMREVHLAYYAAYQMGIPPKYVQKYPLPIMRQKRKKPLKYPKGNWQLTSRDLDEFQKKKK